MKAYWGCRTASSYQDSPTYEADREQAARVAQCLKDNGWELASHSWGHLHLGVADDPRPDLPLTRNGSGLIRTNGAEVESLIGPTDIILYPYGNDIADWRPYHQDNPRFAYLESKGFRYFCNVRCQQALLDADGDKLFRMARRNLDGYRL